MKYLHVFAALLAVVCSYPAETHAAPPGKGGGAATYKVYFSIPESEPGPHRVTSDCDGSYVNAVEDRRGQVHASGNDLDLRFTNTGVTTTRKYPNPANVTFNGCLGVTASDNGNLFIFFEKTGGVDTVRFIWHFEYYIDSKNREHFTLTSGSIPFAPWTGASVSGRVSGTFDLKYYLKEGKSIKNNYTSLTGGQGIPFDFVLALNKQP